MLEILAHSNRAVLPGAHHVAAFVIPDDVPVTVVDAADVPDWDAPGATESRAIGDRWLDRRATAVLIVPSVIAAPYERNVVIDPTHRDFALIHMHAPVRVTWDPRLPGR